MPKLLFKLFVFSARGPGRVHVCGRRQWLTTWAREPRSVGAAGPPGARGEGGFSASSRLAGVGACPPAPPRRVLAEARRAPPGSPKLTVGWLLGVGAVTAV